MALSQHEVRRSASIPASADQVWSIVRDFCGVWHPAIESMTSEYDDQGGLIRAFTLAGDPTTYRERLTWYSDSKRSMAYTHIDGIAGADSYTARLFVTPDPEPLNVSCTVTLSARLTAAEPRASEIAAGTKFIFDDAIAVIKTLATSATSQSVDPALTISNPLGQIRTHRIDGTPSLTISFCDGPDKTNDTLCLFLHGIGGNRSNWSQQLNAVALWCNVAALDLRGYGGSALGDKPSTIEDYCTDILRVAESLGAKKLILCGLSYGAWIATSFATHHADRLSALVLSGGCTGMSEADKEERDTFRNSREVPLALGQTPADFAPAVVSVLAGPDITDTARLELLESMRAIPSETYADALHCFTNPVETFDFTSFTMPVLLMTGDADKLAPPREIKQIAERIHDASPKPDVRYECLQGAGHVCNLEVPHLYNSALIELIKRVL